MKPISARPGTRRRYVRAGLTVAAMRLILLAGMTAMQGSEAAAVPGGSPIIIRDDRGGSLDERSDLIRQYRAMGQRVELRGTCLSACTMYLGLPDICIAPEASFGFHGPSRHGRQLPQAEFEHWSQVMARHYIPPLRDWYLATARFRMTGYHQLSGAELIRLGYPSC